MCSRIKKRLSLRHSGRPDSGDDGKAGFGYGGSKAPILSSSASRFPILSPRRRYPARRRAGAGSWTTTDKIFDTVRRIRSKTDVPLAFMTYINPIFAYNADKFMKNCRDAGIDAIIVPDLPFEEKNEIKPVCEHYGINAHPRSSPLHPMSASP
jgi:hypothetical protein